MIICRDCKITTETIACHCTHCGGTMEVFRRGKDASFALGCWMVLVFLAYLGLVRTDWSRIDTAYVSSAISGYIGYALPGHHVPQKTWVYGSMTDLGGAIPITQAYVPSTNSVRQADGTPVTARLLVRNHPRFGRDVIVSVSAGIINCDGDKGCHVDVSFDKSASRSVYAHLPRDKTPTILFVGEYDDMIKDINESRLLQVAIPTPAGDVRRFSFDVTGLSFR